MPFSEILLCLDPTPAGAARLELASRLARTHGARLVGVYPLYDEAVVTVALPADQLAAAAAGAGAAMTGLAGSEFAGINAEPPVDAEADAAALRFREGLGRNGLEGDWHLVSGSRTAETIELAKLADLAVLGQTDRNGGARPLFRPEEIALGCGNPAVIVPYAGNFPTIGARVLVAWDATREAARAVHDAIPLMTGAQAVLVMTVASYESNLGPARVSLEQVVRHLGHHGISAQSEATLRGELGVADVLLARAADFTADLIVAGAYHHSQTRQALFGGVTYDLLDHMTVPVLMSH